MTRLLVGPFNRVEGDLEVQLEIEDGQVRSAQVNATMYRGFEQILLNHAPLDALVYAPRICGICSVSQSVAAARALAELAGVQPPANGLIATNLMAATENLADHLSHFYLFFMPDFVRPLYAERPWYADAVARFTPHSGSQQRLALAARKRWLDLIGTLGGKWPHTGSVHPGGSTRALDAAERLRLLARVREFRQFLESELFAAPLERIAELASEGQLWAWYAEAPEQGDLRRFLRIVQDSGLEHLGQGPGLYLSYGAYPQADGSLVFARGLWNAASAQVEALDLGAIREDASHAWLDDSAGPLHPARGETEPSPDKPAAYTWNKAPRLAGAVLETGALARQLVAGQALLRDAAARCGGSVYTRLLARLVELARVVPLMESWLLALRPGEPYYLDAALPDSGSAVGLNEAARGALGHWLRVEHGRIASYQIIAPTTWNFSPRDAQGRPGALEQALQGAPVRPGEKTPVAVQHIVRSFDPCMVCTVH
ncbi:nickel-dependent hydrogenase large subunit [Pseudomonas panipatensis]|uniref:Hydrogenase large subunit n=1 Tax=Pseudomonas panipatensis TaxID=428992 RepID=A0A1G8LIX5_9PSED|nr:nickel-dependent hydrogenase large subunit [Pseudomonas panipatensis]SDI55598.1 hydrogenase large subunit [Pseudomonas panipatensis]SMP74797.1 hydrogenase large subunit [Pseudomonas panipatensis]